MIQRLSIDNINDIIHICKISLPNEGFNDYYFLEEHFKHYGYSYGYFMNGVLVGFIFCINYQLFTYIMAIAIYPEFSNQGIGQRLLQKVIMESNKQLICKIEISNFHSIKLFKKFGFLQIPKKHIPKELSKNFRTTYYPFFRKPYQSWGLYDPYTEIANLQDRIKNLNHSRINSIYQAKFT